MVVGGAERVLIDTVNNMNPNKYDITVIAIYKQSVYDNYQIQFKDLFNDYIKFRYLVDNTNALKYKLFNYTYARFDKGKIYSRYIKEVYDIEVACYEGMPTEFISYSTNSCSKKYAWLQTDNARLYKGKTKEYIQNVRTIYEKYDWVVGSSSRVVESFEKFFPGMKTKMVHNVFQSDSIINKSFEPCKIIPKNETVILLTVGRLTPVKGYERLLNAVNRLKIDGFSFELYMLGDGELKDSFKSFVDQNNLNDCVKLLGNQDNPYAFMRNSSFLVCSSIAEGFSTVAVEAILCELPVLTTKVAGMTDIFGECKCGEICDNSEEGIYQMLKYQLQHPELRKVYADECKKRMGFFSIEKRIKDIEALYDEA